MLQAVLKKPEKLIFQEVDVQKFRNDEILIEVKVCGICGSDIHTYFGKHPFVKKYPLIQGHEFSGTVADLGKDVENFVIGQKVTAQPQVVCGTCYNCKIGRYNICSDLKVFGFQLNGCMRKYFPVPSKKVIPLPESISYEQGALIEPLSVAVHSVKKAGSLLGKKVLILGSGTIGRLTSSVAKCFGVGKVMITDISDFRLQIAKKFSDYQVNILKKDIIKEVKKYFGEPDLIFECVGVEDAVNSAIEIARKGSKILIVGVFSNPVLINIGLVQDKELEIIGSLMYQREDFLTAIDIIHKREIKPELLITDRFRFEELVDVYNFIKEKRDKVLKVMIEF